MLNLFKRKTSLIAFFAILSASNLMAKENKVKNNTDGKCVTPTGSYLQESCRNCKVHFYKNGNYVSDSNCVFICRCELSPTSHDPSKPSPATPIVVPIVKHYKVSDGQLNLRYSGRKFLQYE